MDIVPVQLTTTSAANHVIAVLYKEEFAGERGFIDPYCTERACFWNTSNNKDIQIRGYKIW